MAYPVPSLAARPFGGRRLRSGALEPSFNAGDAAQERTGRQSPKSEPALAIAEDALQWLIVACVGSLPRLTASAARDDEDGRRSRRHVDAHCTAGASGAVRTPGRARTEAGSAPSARSARG